MSGSCNNNGEAFKLTCRDESGVIVTLIADNYFGYCKKEIKTQISYAANLFGLCEEEHAGGALVFPSYDLGEEFSGDVHVKSLGHSFAEVTSLYGEAMEVQPEGCAVDKKYPEIIYVPEDARFDLRRQTVSWRSGQGERAIRLLLGKTYVRPSGYKVRLEPAQGSLFLAAGRHRGRGPAVSQAVYGLRRRQVGDFQADYRRGAHRAGVRGGFQEGF